MTPKEIQDRMEVCPWRERPTGNPYVCTRYYGTIVPCDGACSWVVDYPKLKELKAQKGEEEWRDCVYYPDYQVSNLGNVVRKKDGVLMQQYTQKSGYVYVWLTRKSGTSAIPVHRLVCIAFHGEWGYKKGLFVDHINTIRSDNRACNLRWVTPKENANNETTKLNRKKKWKGQKN